MAPNIQNTIFLLGATGYLGSQFLILLSRRPARFHVVALVRNPSPWKEAKLKSIYQDLTIVEGNLDDSDLIEEEAARAKYVINCASPDHYECIEAILDGLGQQSEDRPGDPPLYIHLSGLGMASDNARGELIDEDNIPRYTDIGFSLDQVPPDNPHVHCDMLVAEAGVRKENPVRTIMAYPGWVYGLGEGMSKTTSALRAFLGASRTLKYAGTWGPGHNSMRNIHVKDCANAILMILEAAVAGRADEGAEGHYFLVSNAPYVTFGEISTVIGDIMFGKGIYTRGGSQPLPPSVANAYGESGWRVLGGNNRVDPQRLKRLGWEATETNRVPLLKSLPLELEVALHEMGY
ncbi:hypothetical protein GALMADRAFT_250148 [Galerina marginata CBS 339.88]|uniref:NmrA-like domain-containing protein n=1 Tax=Galerina marginata (strain CBS 339.88) TaxID=685588 RepID=A0A067SW81_GALM3|nr:hypothetical protein GALMADRAFT_250148 [Galerina marginata CBS 339.88]